MRIRLRKAEAEDIAGIRRLFRETVLKVNVADYTREETEDWAACGEDLSHWEKLMEGLYFVVAEVVEGKSNRVVPNARTREEEMVGFASISEEGYLHSMFVHHGFQGCGVATALLKEMEDHAYGEGVEKIWSEVSITARSFFEGEGYEVVKEQRRKAKQMELVNFVMEKGWKAKGWEAKGDRQKGSIK